MNLNPVPAGHRPVISGRRRAGLSIALAFVVALVGTTVAATPAQAETTTCTNTGCPDYGPWNADRKYSWWANDIQGSNYPDMNCTNYAAWKLIRNGAPGPLYLGNAHSWDERAASRGFAVNGTPAVGAIAQWNSGEYGHVAYVEGVIGNTVWISESNWGGAWLRWRSMHVSEVENFIHIKDVAAATPPPPSMLSARVIGTPDFNGDGKNDVFRVMPNGTLYLYTGSGTGTWASGSGFAIGAGWETFSKVIAPGDFSGDGNADLIGVFPDGTMRLFKGNGTGGWLGAGVDIGAGFNTQLAFSPGDFNSDGHPDIMTVRSNGELYLYKGDGAGGWINPLGTLLGSGWSQFVDVLGVGDYSGDGNPDVIGALADGRLSLYTGNGAGQWANSNGGYVGSGFQGFQTLTATGDFSGDGKVDMIGVTPTGLMYLYRGTGTGGWVPGGGVLIGSSW